MTEDASWFAADPAQPCKRTLTWADRFRGAMLGGAVGDALGAGVRTRTTWELQHWFGQQGVIDYLPIFGRRGAVTDLSQLTAFTLEALLRAKAVNGDSGEWLPTPVVRTNHLRWLFTQGVPWEYAMSGYLQTHPGPSGWLLERPELFSTRNPGGDALSSLGKLAQQPPQTEPGFGGPARPGFADCIVWAAPTMVWGMSENRVLAVGADIARMLTEDRNVHGAAGFHADVLAQLIQGDVGLWDAVSLSNTRLGALQTGGNPAVAVRRTVHAAMFATRDGRRPSPAELDVEFDTEQGPGELGVALAAVASTSNYVDAVLVAVNQSADSSVTGALAGQIAGALYGPAAIPPHWLEELELREIFETLCVDATEAFAPPPPPPPLPRWAQRYVGDGRRAPSEPREIGGVPNTGPSAVDGRARPVDAPGSSEMTMLIDLGTYDPSFTGDESFPAAQNAQQLSEPGYESTAEPAPGEPAAPSFVDQRTDRVEMPFTEVRAYQEGEGGFPQPDSAPFGTADVLAEPPVDFAEPAPGVERPHESHAVDGFGATAPDTWREVSADPETSAGPAVEPGYLETPVESETGSVADPLVDRTDPVFGTEEAAPVEGVVSAEVGSAAAAAYDSAVSEPAGDDFVAGGPFPVDPAASDIAESVPAELDPADPSPAEPSPAEPSLAEPSLAEPSLAESPTAGLPAAGTPDVEHIAEERGDTEPPDEQDVAPEMAGDAGTGADEAENPADDGELPGIAEPEPETPQASEPQRIELEPALMAAAKSSTGGGHAKIEGSDFITPSLTERVLGCLLGGALGDALGADLEFVSAEEITERFGSHGPRGLREAYGVRGAITDDTQLTLFTAEGLVRGSMAQRLLGSEDPLLEVQLAYQRWLHTQGLEWKAAAGPFHADYPAPDGWLVQNPGLFASRAPGKSVSRALSRFADGQPMGSFTDQVNDSKGCGGVMRAAPAALYSPDPPVAFELAARTAALTHGHPSGYLSAGALAVIVQQALLGQSLDDGVWLALQVLETWEGYEETSELLTKAVELASDGVPTPQQIEETLGGGWVGEEALAIAVCAALAGGDDVELALSVAVHHSGDSDSVGAVCGNIVGALLGVAALPVEWLADLELREVVEQMALDCVAQFGGDDFTTTAPEQHDPARAAEQPVDAEWNERYPVRPLPTLQDERIAQAEHNEVAGQSDPGGPPIEVAVTSDTADPEWERPSDIAEVQEVPVDQPEPARPFQDGPTSEEAPRSEEATEAAGLPAPQEAEGFQDVTGAEERKPDPFEAETLKQWSPVAEFPAPKPAPRRFNGAAPGPSDA